MEVRGAEGESGGIFALRQAAARLNELTERSAALDANDIVMATIFLMDYERQPGALMAELGSLISETLARLNRDYPEVGRLFTVYRQAPDEWESVPREGGP